MVVLIDRPEIGVNVNAFNFLSGEIVLISQHNRSLNGRVEITAGCIWLCIGLFNGICAVVNWLFQLNIISACHHFQKSTFTCKGVIVTVKSCLCHLNCHKSH